MFTFLKVDVRVLAKKLIFDDLGFLTTGNGSLCSWFLLLLSLAFGLAHVSGVVNT